MAKRFYITTPIYYVNSVPHIGTALTTVAADVTARYRKMRGDDVMLLTGTDENATKVAEAAEAAGKSPQAFVDDISAEFEKIWKGLGVEYDDFIRTTEDRHKVAVQEVFSRLLDAGHIYKDKYEGWYDVGSETFFKESDLVDGKSPDGNDVRWVSEENYFFRLSAFADRLLKHIEDNPEFILPETRKNEVVSFIKQGLRDSAITRTNTGWGIPVPGDDSQVIYVWFDALINYISAIGWPANAPDWPADVQWMGKDILVRFHATLWPAMLMGLGLPLPKTLIGHGWILFGNEKISKSKGNVVAPMELADELAVRAKCSIELAVDAVRYYMCRTMPFESDYSFSQEDFELKFNTELVNDLSNGVHRVISMSNNFLGGKISGGEVDGDAVALMAEGKGAYESAMEQYRIDEAVTALRKCVAFVNQFIDNKKPWELNKQGSTEELAGVMRSLCFLLRSCSAMVSPVAPNLSAKIDGLLGLPRALAWDAVGSPAEFGADMQLRQPEPIYTRLEKEKKMEETPVVPEDEITLDDFIKVKLRVARVLDAAPVPDSDKLMRLDLVVGDEKRQVLAGIAQQYTADDLIGRQVVVVVNLKPRKMRGLESQGMVLAADAEGGGAILLMPDKEAPEGTSVH
ncbi:MAG: methionine--tRNA ligase [Armatimonadota bacterium]|nr:methionine--tRNA ligase [Armatimonadota bacterium]